MTTKKHGPSIKETPRLRSTSQAGDIEVEVRCHLPTAWLKKRGRKKGK